MKFNLLIKNQLTHFKRIKSEKFFFKENKIIDEYLFIIKKIKKKKKL